METDKFMIHTIDFTLMVFSIIAVFLFVMGLYVSPRSSVVLITTLFWWSLAFVI
jgi:hypothetical protein